MRKLSLLSTLAVCAFILVMVNPLQAIGPYKFSSSPNAPILDRATTVDQIYIANNIDIAEVRVGLHINHGRQYDLKITLRGPNGQSCILKNPAGAGFYGSIGSQYTHALYKDGGPGPVYAHSPDMGVFNPVTPLLIFGGIKSQGWWQLIVEDQYLSAEGVLVSWDIFISGGTVVPPKTIFTKDGENKGYVSNSVLIPPVGTGGTPENAGTTGDGYRNFISGSGIANIGTSFSGRLTISLDLNHTYDGDLYIYFGKSTVSPVPAGPQPSLPAISPRIKLQQGRGGGADDINVIYDDMSTTSITTFTGGGGGARFRPEEALSTFNGGPLDGTWFLEIYDHYNIDNGALNYWSINYEAAGFNVLQPSHEAMAQPLAGAIIPRAIPGAIIGYVPDIVSTIPPYAAISKAEQPTFAIWTNNKMFSKKATGFERIEALDKNTGAIPYSGYWGPYMYTTDGATYVNADLLQLTSESKYQIRTTLSSREDDVTSDNVAYSGQFDLTPVTLSYAGPRQSQWNQYQAFGYTGYGGNYALGAGTQYGMAFTVFKSPTSKLTSVDIFLDSTAVSTNLGDTKIQIYPVASGFIGAPLNTPVGESPTLTAANRIEENWYTYPIGPVGSGVGGINLVPGTYIISLAVVTGTISMYGYSFPMMRTEENGYYAMAVEATQSYGPLLPTSAGTTKLLAQSTSLTSAPSSNSIVSYGNGVMSLRANFVTQNDFAIEKITPRGSINISGAPFIPTVTVKSASPQNGTPQGFNVLVSVYNFAGQKIYSSEKTGTVTPYGSTDLSFNAFTPATPGDYIIEAMFSRNPLDQNKMNDKVRARLVIYHTGVAVVIDENTSIDVINATRSELASQGVTNARFINRSKETVDLSNYQTIFWAGNTTTDDQSMLRNKLADGAQVAYIARNNNDTDARTTLQNVDKVFQLERAQTVNYDRVKMAMRTTDYNMPETSPTPTNVEPIQINSKEDLLKLFMQNKNVIEETVTPPMTQQDKETINAHDIARQSMPKLNPEELLPPVVTAPYGNISYVTSYGKDIQFIFAIPERIVKNSGITTTAAAPTGFSLEQNYPNPFNPQTMINYTLAEPSFVRLRVYDVLGREINTLVNYTQDAGRFTITWKGMDNNGASIASGIYFYRLEASPLNGGVSFVSQKKMTYSK